MIKNILITGGNGFIGKNLKEFLQNDYRLFCPRSYELDICDAPKVREFFGKNNIDFIIHCATVGGVRDVKDAPETLDNNVSMVKNLIKYKSNNTNMIIFGSGAMYDKNRNLHKIKESQIGKVIPKDLYGLSKLKIFELVKNRQDTTCLNIFGCYGKYEKQTRFPTYAISQNIEHKPIIINQNVVFDYMYIKDLLKIIHYFMHNKPFNNVINVTPTISISLLEIAKIINKISDYKSDIIIKNKELNYEYSGDNSILLKNIDVDFTTYEQGLMELYGVLNENRKLHI